MTDAIKDGTRGLNESLETIAKKHGMKYTRLAYGAKMKHPTIGEIDINRYGEWHHKGTNKTGDSEEMFSSLDKHLSTVKKEVEAVDEGMFSPPKMITGKAAENRKNYLRNYHPRLIAAKKAAGSSKDYDYEPQRDSETGGTKPSTHKNVYNSNKFKPATKMSFEAGLKRAAERAKSKTNEEVSLDESSDWKQGFLDDYNVLRGHKNPEVKKHLTAAEINFKNENWQNAHSYMQKAKNAARTSKQANEEVSLDEGRGRPPKEGSAAWKKRQSEGGGDSDTPGLHGQLIKHKSLQNAPPKIKFTNGEEAHISPAHRDLAIKHLEGMIGPGKNPEARDAAVNAMSKSHAGLMQAIGVEPKPEGTKNPMSAQKAPPKLSLTKEESNMSQEDIVEKLQAALDAGILSQNDFDKLTQITDLDEAKILFHPGQKAIVHSIDHHGLLGRNSPPPRSGVEGHPVRIKSYGDTGKEYGIEGGEPGNPRIQILTGTMAGGPHTGKTFEFAGHELKKHANEEVEAVAEDAPMYNVRNSSGTIVGTHSHTGGFKPSRPESGLQPGKAIPQGHTIDRSSPVNKSPSPIRSSPSPIRSSTVKEDSEQLAESPSHLGYSGTVGKKEYTMTIPNKGDGLGDYSDERLHKLITKQNPHLEHHEVSAIVNSGGDEDSDQTVEHKGKKYTHRVVNYQEPRHLYNEVNYTGNPIDEKALSPKQKEKIDKNKNGKIDRRDFELLRKEETTAGVAAVVAALSRNLKELK